MAKVDFGDSTTWPQTVEELTDDLRNWLALSSINVLIEKRKAGMEGRVVEEVFMSLSHPRMVGGDTPGRVMFYSYRDLAHIRSQLYNMNNEWLT